MTDPLVSLNGVTATLTDGSVVQFLSQGKATIAGAFSTALAQYDVVDQAKAGGYALINSLDIAVNADSQAVLDGSHQGHGPRHRRICAISRPARSSRFPPGPSCSCRWPPWFRWIPRRS